MGFFGVVFVVGFLMGDVVGVIIDGYGEFLLIFLVGIDNVLLR